MYVALMLLDRPSTHAACVVWNLEHSLHAAFLAQNFFTGLLLFTQWPKYDWIHMQTEVKNKITLESTAIYHFLNFKNTK